MKLILLSIVVAALAFVALASSTFTGGLRTDWVVNGSQWDPPYLTTRLSGESDSVWLSRHIREVDTYMHEEGAEPEPDTYIVTSWSSQADPYHEDTLATGDLYGDLKTNENQVEAAFGQHPPD